MPGTEFTEFTVEEDAPNSESGTYAKFVLLIYSEVLSQIR